MTESAESRSPSPEKCDDTRSAYKKSNKPLMEKRRRARINTCLAELKTLVLQAMKKDNAHYSKLEKADILELTVKHLRAIQRQQNTVASLSMNSNVLYKYRAGFNECANEISRYLASVPGVQDDIKGRVLGHLANCMHNVNTSTSDRIPPIHQQLLNPLAMPNPAFLANICPDKTTAFQPVIRDNSSQVAKGIPCLASTPIQLIHPNSPPRVAAFVLTNQTPVQAVPLYASPPSGIKVEPMTKEEPVQLKVLEEGVNDKTSAFRDVLQKNIVSPAQSKDVEDHMWRPW